MGLRSDYMTSRDIDAKSCTFAEYNSLFEAHGGTDSNYLRKHFLRFQNTFKRAFVSWSSGEGPVVVDVGAHWLHQSLFYALAGCKIEAFNAPTTFKKERVRRLADAYGINLTMVDELETGECFYGLPENSVDIVLFTEILEHITFNPVRFWKIIYRILKPGGRIIVTTPNYYNLNGRAYASGRFFSGGGGGIAVDEILRTHTYGHHWKEYSMREVVRYFTLLSPDLRCIRCEYTDDRNPEDKNEGIARESLEKWFPFLRPGLYVEVELIEKKHGIELKPEW